MHSGVDTTLCPRYCNTVCTRNYTDKNVTLYFLHIFVNVYAYESSEVHYKCRTVHTVDLALNNINVVAGTLLISDTSRVPLHQSSKPEELHQSRVVTASATDTLRWFVWDRSDNCDHISSFQSGKKGC